MNFGDLLSGIERKNSATEPWHISLKRLLSKPRPHQSYPSELRLLEMKIYNLFNTLAVVTL